MNARSLIAKSILTGALPLVFLTAALSAPADAAAIQDDTSLVGDFPADPSQSARRLPVRSSR